MSDLRQSLKALVDCPICLGPFKDPRMLVCLHSLCRDCLDDHITANGKNGHFSCPECRREISIPTAGADDFPRNFFINKYMELVSDTATGARSKTRQTLRRTASKCCNSEEEDECEEPEQFCLVCREYFCKACSKAHRKAKASREHKQVALEELTDEMLAQPMALVEVLRCSKHRKKLKLYCSRCQTAVCSICCMVDHHGHIFREITDVDEECKSELEALLSSLENTFTKMSNQKKELDRAQENLESHRTRAKNTTRNILEKLYQLLKDKMSELDRNIDKVCDKDVNAADVETKNVTLNIQLLESLLSFVRHVTNRGSAFNRLACLPEIRSRVQQFQEDSPEAAVPAEVPSVAELAAKQLDGLLLEHEVRLDEAGGESGPTVGITIKCSVEPKAGGPRSATMSLVVYNAESWSSSLVQQAIDALPRVKFDVSNTVRPLRPVSTTDKRVDITVHGDQTIHSLVAELRMDESPADSTSAATKAPSSNKALIDKQVATGHIKTKRVEQAFLAVDRGHYYQSSDRSNAYSGSVWKVGNLHLSAPDIYAMVTEALELAPGMSFLNLGSGTGYLSTVAGFLLGPYGVNHGVEIFPDVVTYAREKLDAFKKGSSFDQAKFCEPVFTVGNGVSLETGSSLYDRIYCGAACPAKYENYMKKLLKVGGILVMPFNKELLKIKRTETGWDSRAVCGCIFAELRDGGTTTSLHLGRRNLVLIHVSDKADDSATRALLAKHDKLFDHIVVCQRGAPGSATSLARYLLDVANRGNLRVCVKDHQLGYDDGACNYNVVSVKLESEIFCFTLE